MISSSSTYNCSSTPNNCDPCSAIIPYSNKCNNSTTNNRYGKNAGIYRSSNCYRPLQQLYKTIYPPTYENNSSRNHFTCICRPSERYKTTNMTYGSFHYNNWAYLKKNRPINYDRELFVKCYDSNTKQQKMNCQTEYPNHITNAYNSNESQYWNQLTSDACCPTDCCSNITTNVLNC